MDEKKIPRRQSKADRIRSILDVLNRHIDSGMTSEQAIEKLTITQYDFLIDNDVNLDSLLLTAEQQKAVEMVKKSPRPTFPNGYRKKYPADKMELFRQLETFVTQNGGTIADRTKENYRDLDFEIDGKQYRIVLSQPRTKKT